MEINTLANGKITRDLAQERYIMQTAANMLVDGKIIRNLVKE
jgi:hypothetical protein